MATPTAPPSVPFPVGLMRERARMGLSRKDVADQAGVPVGTVKRWERGEATPSVQQFKRIQGQMRRLAASVPDWQKYALVPGAQEYVDAKAEFAREGLEAWREDPPQRPTPITFGAGLRKAREENDTERYVLAELLGLTVPAITQWEDDDAQPVQANLVRLFQLLPELEAAVSVGVVMRPRSQDIPIPSGGRGAQRVGLAEFITGPALTTRPTVVEPQPEPSTESLAEMPEIDDIRFKRRQPVPAMTTGELAQSWAEAMVLEQRAAHIVEQAKVSLELAHESVRLAAERTKNVFDQLTKAIEEEAKR